MRIDRSLSFLSARLMLSGMLLSTIAFILYLPFGHASIPEAAPPPFQEQPAAGKFLIANESIRDPRFRESVILLLNHDAGGSVGLIINRPTRIPLDSVFDADLEGLLLFGGPVQPSVFSLLVLDGTAASTGDEGHSYVLEGVWFVFGTEGVLERLPGLGEGAKARVYAGYAGWGPGQLDAEIRDGGWRLLTASPAAIFAEDPSRLWGELMRRAGGRWI